VLRGSLLICGLAALIVSAGCQPGGLFPSVWLRKPAGPGMPSAVVEYPPLPGGATTQPSPQPMLMVPAVGNAAQTSVFEELADVREQHTVMQTSLGEVQSQADRTEQELDAEAESLRITRSELLSLEQRVAVLTAGVQRCQRDLDQMRQQQSEQQARDIETLDELNRTVDSLLDQARSVRHSTGVSPGPAPAPEATAAPAPPVPSTGPAH
jgi:hypothetical protein